MVKTSGRLARVAGVWLALVLLVLGGALPAAAKSQLIRVDANGPVDVRADEVEYDERTTTYYARGEVEIVRGKTRLFADRVRLNAKTLIAEAEGKVRLTTTDQVLTGRRMVVDLQGGTGKIYQGQVFVRTTHYYLRGEEIEKTGRDTYHLRYGSFTTCDGSHPAWKVTGEDMKVTLEGYGTAKNTAFRVGNVPVLWAPYLVFPAKFRRQSGLLPPQLGVSERDGFFISQPYFQTLGDDQDLTFTPTWMSDRGIDLGLEYRYHLAPGSKGMAIIDYMPNDSKGEELYLKGDNAAPYNDRYWFRAMADQKLFGGTTSLKLDLDLVSDQDYLREFTYGYNGFDNTNQRFIEWFGRELSPNTSLVRESKLNLQRSWSNAAFNASLLYYDDLATNNKATLQELPYLSFDATRQPVGDTGLYFWMGSSYHYYYRQEGTTGHIVDLSPTISLPLNFNDYFSLEPSFTYQPRLYWLSLKGSDEGLKKQGINQLWNFQVKTSTYLYRVYDFGDTKDPMKVKHAFRPYLKYLYQPEVDEDNVASLATRSQDRKNQLSYGIENAFTYKIMAKDEKTGQMVPTYREFLRLNFSHSFDLEKYYKEGEAGNDNHWWGNLNGRLEFEPSRFIYAQAEASWNLYDNTFEKYNFQVIANDRRGDAVFLDWQANADTLMQLKSRLKLAVTDEWSLNYINRHDFDADQDFETTYEVRYEGQCWGLRFFYTDSIRERGYFVAFSLGGFGELFGYGQTRQD